MHSSVNLAPFHSYVKNLFGSKAVLSVRWVVRFGLGVVFGGFFWVLLVVLVGFCLLLNTFSA